MRDYLRPDNLLLAAAMAAVVTLLSVGRLLQGEWPLFTGVVMLFLSMTLVCAAVTAWGGRAGMPGVWTDRRTLARGVLAAVVLGVAAWPVYLAWLDPRLRAALAANGGLLRLAFPPTAGSRAALVLWATGFQTLFLLAAPMSVAARLTGSRGVAIGFCVLFRLYLAHRQLTEAGITEHLALLMLPAAAMTAVAGLLFARFGLAPAMLLTAVLSLRLFLN